MARFIVEVRDSVDPDILPGDEFESDVQYRDDKIYMYGYTFFKVLAKVEDDTSREA